MRMSESLPRVKHAASTTRQSRNVHLALTARAMRSMCPSTPALLQPAGVPVLEADAVSVLHRAASSRSPETGS